MSGKLRDDQIKWILSLDAKGLQSELIKTSSLASALTDENKKLEAELKLVEKDMRGLEKDMNRLSAAGDTQSEKFARLRKTFLECADDANDLRSQIDANKRSIEDYNKKTDEMVRTLRTEDMTMAQLTKTAKDLQTQLNNTSQSTDPAAYAELEKRLNEVRGRMGELNKGSSDSQNIFAEFTSGVNKYWAAVVAGYKTVEGAFSTFKDLMMSNKATGELFQAELDGLRNGFEYLQVAVANMDFTDLLKNMGEAVRVGRDMSLVLAELFERTNSFKLTSTVEKAEIEQLKTDLRDVNLSNQERLEIGEKIIEKTKALASEEKDIAQQRVMATQKLMQAHTKMTDAEIEYTVTNYNANREALNNARKIIELENKKAQFKDGFTAQEIQMNNSIVKSINEEITALKNVKSQSKDTGEWVQIYSQQAYNSMKKYMQGNNELIANMVNAKQEVEQIDVNTNRELRRTETMMSRLTKNENKGSGSSVDKELQKQQKELAELNKKLETKYLEDQAKIKKDYRDGEIKSESEFNRKLYASEQAYYILREAKLKEFADAKTKTEVKDDANKQIADIQNKQLDQEIKFREKLEKIVLDANPMAKEKQAYEERLRDVDLYEAALLKEKGETGEALTNLTDEQLKALELLEKQHADNVSKIKKDALAQEKADAEVRFNDDFKARKDEMQLELNDLMATAAGTKTFDAEMQVHMQRMQMINEEIEARRKAGLDTTKQIEQQGKLEANMTAAVSKELDKRANQYKQYGSTIGQALGSVMSGQEDALAAFGDATLDIMFDILSQIIQNEIIKVMASSTSNIMKATAEAMSTPGSALTFGAQGFATTAILVGAITAATVAAKAGLKALLGKKKSSSSSSSSSSSAPTSSGSITVKPKGYAEGGLHTGYTGDGAKYDVKGTFPDGEPYHAGEYIIPKAKLKIPWVSSMVKRIDSTIPANKKRNPLPKGFAEGGYHTDGSADAYNPDGYDRILLERVTSVLENIDEFGVRSNIAATEVQAQLNNMHRENARFTKK